MFGVCEDWDVVFVCELFDVLFVWVWWCCCLVDYECVWLNFVGYCLCLGFGYLFDVWCIE